MDAERLKGELDVGTEATSIEASESKENEIVATSHDARLEKKLEEDKRRKRKELARQLLRDEKLFAGCALSPITASRKSHLNLDKENLRNDRSTSEQFRNQRSSPRLNKCSQLRMRSAESFIHKLDQAEKIRNGADEQEKEMSIGWTIDDQGRHMPIPDWHEKRKQKDPSRGGGPRARGAKKKSPPCKPSEIEHGCNSDKDCRTDSRTSQTTTLQSKMSPAEASYMTGSQHSAAIFHDLDHDSDQLYLTPTNRVLTVEDLAEQQYYKYLSSSKMQKANQKLSDTQVMNEVNRKFFFDGDTVCDCFTLICDFSHMQSRRAGIVQWIMKAIGPPGQCIASERNRDVNAQKLYLTLQQVYQTNAAQTKS